MSERMLYCNLFTITPACKWYLEEFLGMDTYFVNVNACVFIDGKGGYFEPPDRVYISQDATRNENEQDSMLRTLFHELRHYYQFKTGMFQFIPEHYTRPVKPEWTKQRAELERFLDYLCYPWELDARESAMKAVPKFLKTDMGKPFRPKPLKKPKKSALSRLFSFAPVQAEPSYPSFAS